MKIGIYHSKDLDGHCSAAVMKLKYPNIELIGYDYADDINEFWKYFKSAYKDVKIELIIIADVCLPNMFQMGELSEQCEEMIWIDHHKSQIEEKEKFEEQYGEVTWKCYLEVGKSACELCYEYFFPENKLPTTVFLLGKYDTWRKQKEKGYTWEDAYNYQMGMRISENYSINRIIEEITNGNFESISNIGKSIKSYQKQFNSSLVGKNAFEKIFKGNKAIVCNSGVSNSALFDSIWDEERYDVMMRYLFDGNKYNFSIYSTKKNIDCSILAKSMGGGGHKGAAGFSSDTIEIFE